MSEGLKNTNQSSNEEIIDDLTKDLENSMNTRENVPEFVINPTTSAEKGLTEAGDASAVPGPSDSSKKGRRRQCVKVPKPWWDYECAVAVSARKMAEKDYNANMSEDNFLKYKKANANFRRIVAKKKRQDRKAHSKPVETDYQEKDPDKESESDSDSIDEVSLKDAEVDLTDDQKEERRIIGEELKEKGNECFKIGDYKGSVEKYTLGLQTCPLQFSQLRSILYCNRSAARMKLTQYDKAIKDCTKAVELDDKYLKAYIRRAQSYEAKEKLDESLADYKKVLELDPNHKDAQKAVTRLPPLIEEKNEKLKTEMFCKLKDLGNLILKPFGLSTENFQMEKDPESKGYKINFKQ